VRNNPLDGFEVDTVGDNGSNDQIFWGKNLTPGF
jgi:hypothetical protein